MSSEWMKVMLEEISRKKAENEQARAEQVRREEEAQLDTERQTKNQPQSKNEPQRQGPSAPGAGRPQG